MCSIYLMISRMGGVCFFRDKVATIDLDKGADYEVYVTKL